MIHLRLKEILKQQDLTLAAFSEKVGISQSNLSNYINGNISPTLETLEKISVSLGVNITELFKEPDDFQLFAQFNGKLLKLDKTKFIKYLKEQENGFESHK